MSQRATIELRVLQVGLMYSTSLKLVVRQIQTYDISLNYRPPDGTQTNKIDSRHRMVTLGNRTIINGSGLPTCSQKNAKRRYITEL